MIRMNLRIGTKLGISAGIGVLLVVGMVANEQLSNDQVAQASGFAARLDAVHASALAAKVGVRGMQLANRDLRLAHTDAEVDKTLADMRAGLAEADTSLDAAAQQAPFPEQRERFAKVKTLAAAFAAAGADIAAAQKEIFKAEASQVETVAQWTKSLAALRDSPMLTGHGDVETEINNAHQALSDARISFWRYRASPDQTLIERSLQNFDKAAETLKAGHALARNSKLEEAIDGLARIVAAYKDKVTATLKALDLQATIIKERSVPSRMEMVAIIEAAVSFVSQRVDERRAAANAAMVQAGRVGLGVGLMVVLVLVGSAVFSVFNIARPIRRIGAVLLELANGNKAVDIPFAQRADEVGDNARAAGTFKDNLLRIEAMEAEQKQIEARAAEGRKADMHRLAASFEAAIGGIVGSVTSASAELEAAASTLTHTAETTQQLSTVVAGTSEEAAANVQAVASATEELTSSVNEISRQVQESSRIANEAVEQARQTDGRINDLSQAAARIGDVVKLITAIAEQTNLLALNATIEAARAGDAGRGFAVVAQEVKALAAQTAKATDEISTQIAGMQTATRVSVSAIKEIGTTISHISEIATTIASAVEEQGAATQEIARNVQQASVGTTQVASNIIEVNKGAGETGTASSQVLVSAQTLSGEGSRLKEEVARFLATVRAA